MKIRNMNLTTTLRNLAALLFFSSSSSNFADAGFISGKVEVCNGRELNKFPELKSFIQDLFAETYRNVDVKYVKGRKTVLIVYDNGVEMERVTLSDYDAKDEMHALFVKKGFEKLSSEEISENANRKVLERPEAIMRGIRDNRQEMRERSIRMLEMESQKHEIMREKRKKMGKERDEQRQAVRSSSSHVPSVWGPGLPRGITLMHLLSRTWI